MCAFVPLVFFFLAHFLVFGQFANHFSTNGIFPLYSNLKYKSKLVFGIKKRETNLFHFESEFLTFEHYKNRVTRKMYLIV